LTVISASRAPDADVVGSRTGVTAVQDFTIDDDDAAGGDADRCLLSALLPVADPRRAADFRVRSSLIHPRRPHYRRRSLTRRRRSCQNVLDAKTPADVIAHVTRVTSDVTVT